jgi:serine protease Do
MAGCRRRSSLASTATAALLLMIFATATSTMAAPSNAPAPAPAAATATASKGTTAAAAAAMPSPSSTSTPAVADVDAVVGSSASSSSSSSSSNPWPPEVVRALKKTVVNIDLATPVALVDDKRTAATGTGFVVDAARGLVVTNRHISTVSPTVYQVRFNDGSFAPARCVYYDVAQDFAVLKVDPNETTYELTAVELGSAETLRVGDPVLIIGNNEGYAFSAIEGVVSDLRALSDTAGVRPSLDIETTFDSSSGSSGSPVW